MDLFNGVPGGGDADAINLLGDSAGFAGTQIPVQSPEPWPAFPFE